MRNLCFIVAGQKLATDPACDFSGIASNSRGYLRAKFRFSADWKGFKKVAVFTGTGEDIPVALDGDACEIPAGALTGRTVAVALVGQRGPVRITTNTMEFKQITGR